MYTPSAFVNRLGAIVATGFALVYLFNLNSGPYLFDFLIKSLPIFILGLLVYFNLKNSKGLLVSLGLFFSGVGDVILEIDAVTMFVYGMLAFAVAHLFYISVFLRQVKLTVWRVVAVVILLCYSLVLGYILYPNTGAMYTPLIIYLGIILMMAISATLGSKNGFLIALGSWLFIISDSLIAINRFILPFQSSGLWIMITYYAAQGLIAYGSVREFKTG